MSRDTNPVALGIAWDADPEATQYLIYADENDDPNFLAEVDAGTWTLTATVDAPLLQWEFPTDVPADADLAVVSTDGDGRFSSPHSPAEWQDIPLARSPLAGPSAGRILLSA